MHLLNLSSLSSSLPPSSLPPSLLPPSLSPSLPLPFFPPPQALLSEVMKATKAANGLPAEGDDYDYYSSFPGFRTFCSKMGSRVTRRWAGLSHAQSHDMKNDDVFSHSISRLIRHQTLPCYWPPSQAPPTSRDIPGEKEVLVAMAEELDERMEAIVEANDILLERVVHTHMGILLTVILTFSPFSSRES